MSIKLMETLMLNNQEQAQDMVVTTQLILQQTS